MNNIKTKFQTTNARGKSSEVGRSDSRLNDNRSASMDEIPEGKEGQKADEDNKIMNTANSYATVCVPAVPADALTQQNQILLQENQLKTNNEHVL